MPIPEDTARTAHAWYMAEPTRSIEEAALEHGATAYTIRAAWSKLGLPSKGRHSAKRGKPHANTAHARGPKETYAPPRGTVGTKALQRRQRRWR